MCLMLIIYRRFWRRYGGGYGAMDPYYGGGAEMYEDYGYGGYGGYDEYGGMEE